MTKLSGQPLTREHLQQLQRLVGTMSLPVQNLLLTGTTWDDLQQTATLEMEVTPLQPIRRLVTEVILTESRPSNTLPTGRSRIASHAIAESRCALDVPCGRSVSTLPTTKICEK